MFRKVSSLALMICALGSGLCVAAPAFADGWWGRGSIKDRVAVPVPAPAPIPDYAARWYLRADLGLGFVSPDPSESGIIYGQNLYPPQDTADPFRTPGRWTDDDTDTTFSYGGGLGYYWSPYLRTDLTFEGRSQRDLKIRGTYQYKYEEYDDDQNEWVWDGDRYTDGSTSDKAKLDSGLLLFNAYYDFARGGSLTPYIGGGIGVALNKLQRSFSNRQRTCERLPGENCLGMGGASEQQSARDSTYDVTFAAALMAGLTYSISPVTMLDLNYRYLYIGSSDIDLNINGVKSHFSTGDTHEHQVRLGLRWNIQ